MFVFVVVVPHLLLAVLIQPTTVPLDIIVHPFEAVHTAYGVLLFLDVVVVPTFGVLTVVPTVLPPQAFALFVLLVFVLLVVLEANCFAALVRLLVLVVVVNFCPVFDDFVLVVFVLAIF